jgi:hypothetical protein
MVTNLGKDKFGRGDAGDEADLLTRQVYNGIWKFMEPYVVYE